MPRTVLLSLSVVAALSIGYGRESLLATGQEARKAQVGAWPIPLPTKRAERSTPPAPPPDLPPAYDHVPALTFEVVVRREPGTLPALKQTIRRTADRVHLSESKGREWLFERNVRDARRVSGSLTDHRARTIVMYAESDLRMLMGIRGWSDVLLLGFDIEALRSYTPTGEACTIGSVRFTRHTAAVTGLPRHLWWSEHHLLAHEFTLRDREESTRSSITRIRDGVDQSFLAQPELRFPTYRVMNVADWLEHR